MARPGVVGQGSLRLNAAQGWSLGSFFLFREEAKLKTKELYEYMQHRRQDCSGYAAVCLVLILLRALCQYGGHAEAAVLMTILAAVNGAAALVSATACYEAYGRLRGREDHHAAGKS